MAGGCQVAESFLFWAVLMGKFSWTQGSGSRGDPQIQLGTYKREAESSWEPRTPQVSLQEWSWLYSTVDGQ